MAQHIPHEVRHPEAGKWARSQWLWHRVEWQVESTYDEIDAASSCDRYLSPPYVVDLPQAFAAMGFVCKKCLRAAE